MAVEIEKDAPTSLEYANLQPRGPVHPSPEDWGDQILYFLLPDRFSDGHDNERPLFDRNDPERFRVKDHCKWMLDGKAFVGGNLKGIQQRLPYLKSLGVTCLWIAPVWKQRSDLVTYHGYGIQNFLEVDPRFGTRQELRGLVDAAHEIDMYVLLDVIYNHTGNNWFYDDNGSPRETFPFRREPYAFAGWRSKEGKCIEKCADLNEGVWPIEFQDPEWYGRWGSIQNWDEPGKEFARDAEFRMGDFAEMKDLKLEKSEVLDAIIRVYQYWIALSDCDGFRIDTVKHIAPELSAIFCHDIRTFARRLGKKNFMLLGEVTGSSQIVRQYVDPDGPNLDCVLDIESAPQRLADFVKGLAAPKDFFDHFGGRDAMGDVRKVGRNHVSVLDDHDMVWRDHKMRFACGNHSVDPYSQNAHAVGLQLTTPGIPCIYYGTEQCFSGNQDVHDDTHEPRGCNGCVPYADRYVRESMFGGPFGALGTEGCHFFDEDHPTFLRVAAIAKLRQREDAVGEALRRGELYVREIRNFGDDFHEPVQAEVVAWSRVTDTASVVVALNAHGNEARGADITVDCKHHPAGSKMRVLYRSDWNDDQLRQAPEDETREVTRSPDGRCIIRLDLPPAGMMILT